MPRRNFCLLVAVTLVCFACALKVSRYGQILAYAMNEIQDRYLEQIEQRQLFQAALEGMMSRLDENSVYISPQALPQFKESIEQEFGGVGIEILLDPDTNQLTVASPLVDTPAHRAGIRAGDKILRIDGKSTQGLSLEDARSRMRGKPGEPVVLTILHPDEPQPEDIEIVREKIQVPTVVGDTRNADGSWNYFLEAKQYDRIGYLRINSFSERTERELHQALEWLVQRGMQALILDVRNNLGGLLSSAIGVCNLFIDSGEIVSVRHRGGRITGTYWAQQAGTFSGFPMAVLVNGHSASASEIVAACLQDHGRAIVVGERSYGKGTVQELIELQPGQGELKLTTSSYWRPSGKNIHRGNDAKDEDDWGVSPNKGYEVKLDEAEMNKLRSWRFHRDLYRPNAKDDSAKPSDSSESYFDPQLARAAQYVLQQLHRRR